MDDLLHFEDFQIGDAFDCGTVSLSAADIVGFATEYDPQPMHLDPEAARESLLGGLAASGWHVCAIVMRMFYDGVLARAASEGGPGVDEVRWRAPTRPDVALTLRVDVVDARLSRSRPTIGVVSFQFFLSDDQGVVCEQRSPVMVRRRDAARVAAADRPPSAAPSSSDAAVLASLRAARSPSEAASDWFDVDGLLMDRPIDLGAETVDAERILAFAHQFDPQPMHADPVAARQSLFGGHCASGWQTAALWMRRFVAARVEALAALPTEERRIAAAAMGPSPGFRDLKWRRPVFAGDRLRFFQTPREARPMRSRPGWSLTRSDNAAVNQDGELALLFTSHVVMRRRRSLDSAAAK